MPLPDKRSRFYERCGCLVRRFFVRTDHGILPTVDPIYKEEIDLAYGY